MIELNGVRIWAVPYRRRRSLTPRKLPCGSIVREPTPGQRALAPWVIPARFELPGDLAAVYGAVMEPLG